MDLSFGDIMRAAAGNAPIALENQTLWNCDTVIERDPVCPSGIDRSLVIQALREEARIRGVNKEKE